MNISALISSCIFGVVLSSVRKVLEPNDSLNRKLHERRKSVRKDGKNAERTKKEEKRREMQSEGRLGGDDGVIITKI